MEGEIALIWFLQQRRTLFGNNRLRVDILYDIIMNSSNEKVFKNENYYEEIIPMQNPSTFKSNFRLEIATFVYVVDRIGNSLLFHKRSQEFGGFDQVTPEKALLIYLWTLGTPESYRAVGDRFNIGKSTVYHYLKTVTQVLLEEFYNIIKWPNDQEKIEIARRFSAYGFQNCIGAIDGVHIPIKKPKINGEDYYNRKKFYSMVLQAICTPNYLFIDCDIRWPGSVHDARVFRTSDMYHMADELIGENLYLIGDSAYPLKNWLMSPYRNNGHLLPYEIYYNKMLSKTRVVIEHAFALLKGRFRRLRDMLDKNLVEEIPLTVIAACILHNICLIRDEEDIQQYIEEGQEPERNMDIIGDNEEPLHIAVVRRELLALQIWNNQ